MSVTLVIIALTVIASFYAWSKPHIQQKWIFNPYRVNAGKEYYRFITSGFIHVDQMHLLFNMFTFYFFGKFVEQIFLSIFGVPGLILFVAFYLAAIVVSDLPTYLKYKNQPHYNALGASGGVSAILFSSILFFPLNDVCLFGLLCLPGFILGILYLVYSFYQGKQMADNINHDAHLYGALFGVVFTIIIQPPVVISFIEQISSFKLF